MVDLPMNFTINITKENYIEDYMLYYNKKLKKDILKSSLFLVLSITVFLFTKQMLEIIWLESLSFGLIICFLFITGIRINDLLNIETRLKIQAAKFIFRKNNIIIEPTQIKIEENGLKRVIFLSQLKRCIILKDVIFLIEIKDKFLPYKINRNEMSDGAFEQFVKNLEFLKIKIDQ